MTRPKADTDGWLTDPISRDRVIAETVVRGMRDIILLLRGIRDDSATAYRELAEQYRETRDDLIRERARTDMLVEILADSTLIDASARKRLAGTPRRSTFSYTHCEQPYCGLPYGHTDAHRP